MKHKLKGKKKLMIENLISTLGNITRSAEKTGIDRTTHYDWLENDEDYKEAFEGIEDYQVDFYEDALKLLVKDKNPSAIIFALKCKGKKRGWTEKQDISISGGLDNSVKVEDLSSLWEELKKEDKGDDV